MSLLLEKKSAAANELLVLKLERDISAINAQGEVSRMGFELGVNGVLENMEDGDQILDEIIAEIDKIDTTVDFSKVVNFSSV